MPPPKKSVALRHRAHMIASSVEDQEAALMEWRARAQQGKETLQRIRSKMDAHKKSAETTKRGGRWLAEWTSLQREAVSRDLELSKAYASCAHLLPQSLRNKLAEQEEQKNELLGYLSERVTRIRKELEQLHKQKKPAVSRSAADTLRKHLSVAEGASGEEGDRRRGGKDDMRGGERGDGPAEPNGDTSEVDPVNDEDI
ncbi:hypothetical protein C3747_488g7 [Trypanosoma cruzi]|uniref:Uncharacterized protein n=1 Tax=Trypanosoma cruzi TaxID=5693 RepID=A0A2V2UWU3_TRYCR|nr:hypothetical protein C3747_488g7 [Trypanosoma cruzi]